MYCGRMAALEEFEDFIREKVVIERCTYKQVSDQLQQSFPESREKGINKTTDIDDQKLDEVASSAVLQVKRHPSLLYHRVVARRSTIFSAFRLSLVTNELMI